MILENTDDNLKFGMTFSEGISIFKKNGDKNLFEEIITINTIEEDENLSQDDKSKLISVLNSNEYTPFQKRIMIMRTLDKEKEFSSEIGLILRERLPKMEMVKKIMLVFRDHYTKKDVLKKEFGEVLTSVDTVKMMISEIDKEFWTSPYNEDGSIKRILETSNGSGVFLWMVIYKFMVGLKSYFKDEDERYKFIIENMIYACELQKSKMFNWLCIADIYDEYDLNVYCGSFLSKDSKGNYTSELDGEFDKYMNEVWGLKAGDISLCISNPPYQSEIIGNNRAKPIYNLFTEKSIKISERLLFITPSRWLAGGFGLDNFRKMMFGRNDIKVIKHFDDATKIFGNGVEIKGGVSYFLIDKKYNGLVNFDDNFCKLNKYDILVDSKYLKIIDKISKYDSLSTICKSQSYFGFPGNESLFNKEIKDDNIIVYVSKNKGLKMYVDIKNIKDISKICGFKVFTPSASGITGNLGKFGNKILAYPNEVASKSYMTLLVNSKESGESLISYMETKFCNFFLSLRKNTQNMKPDTLKWIPMVPFDREWTDEKLFEYFNLSEEEQKLILEK